MRGKFQEAVIGGWWAAFLCVGNNKYYEEVSQSTWCLRGKAAHTVGLRVVSHGLVLYVSSVFRETTEMDAFVMKRM